MGNWEIKYLPEICEIKTGKHDANHAVNDGKYRFYTCSSEFSRCDTTNFSGESVIVPGNGDIGLVFYYNGEFDAYQRTYVLQNIKIDAKFLYYHMLLHWRTRNVNNQFGSTIRYVRMSNFTNYTISYPLIDEQKRIVAKIEELFSKLDKGIEELNKIKEQLKIYRQAVLKEVFKNISSKKIIKELSDLVTSGSRGWAKYYADKGARFVRITDMTRDGIELKSNTMQFLDLPESVEGRRSRLQCNDVLVSITADLGSIALVPSNIGEAYINQHIAVIRFTNSRQGEFMAWYLKSEYGQKELLKNKRGAGKLGLGLDDIRNTHVPNVDDSIANSIVGEIEQRLSVCDKIEQTVNETLQKAESLRQSILKQAFEGKLV